MLASTTCSNFGQITLLGLILTEIRSKRAHYLDGERNYPPTPNVSQKVGGNFRWPD